MGYMAQWDNHGCFAKASKPEVPNSTPDSSGFFSRTYKR